VSARGIARAAFAAVVLGAAIAPAGFAGSQVTASKAALSTVSPYATQAGLSVLKRGGNAIDAAVAVSFALAVAHPQAGNIGGGGFLVYYEAKSGSVWTLDFREVAPAAAKRDMYLQPDGTISVNSQTGPLAAGVPGTVAGLDAMHRKFGTRPWKELVQPAIALARDGVATDARLERDLNSARSKRKIDQFPSTAALFFPKGKALPANFRLLQNDLAATLTSIADSGAHEFYAGSLADRIVAAVQQAGGNLSHRDLSEYAPTWRAPIRVTFRDCDIYMMPPPSSGGLLIGEVLNILNSYDLAAAGFQTAKALHLVAEAERRAYIDRNKYLGDPATARIPYRELLSDTRAAAWRNTMNGERATPTISLAEPGSTPAVESDHTTHFTIADAEGNVVALTTTLNDNFGSGFVVPGLGFLLNDEMDDFTPAPGKPNRYGLLQGTVNAIEPRKKMASSMSPTIVLRKGKPYLALGTRGGPTIPTTVLQVLLNVVVYGKPLDEAIAAPRYHHQATPDQIDYESSAPRRTVDALNAMGHSVVQGDDIGDVHALMFAAGKIIAVADPRDGGAAGGY
jgi:gamma-glutamyltranspeptidase / glutathione hydrolase